MGTVRSHKNISWAVPVQKQNKEHYCKTEHCVLILSAWAVQTYVPHVGHHNPAGHPDPLSVHTLRTLGPCTILSHDQKPEEPKTMANSTQFPRSLSEQSSEPHTRATCSKNRPQPLTSCSHQAWLQVFFPTEPCPIKVSGIKNTWVQILFPLQHCLCNLEHVTKSL